MAPQGADPAPSQRHRPSRLQPKEKELRQEMILLRTVVGQRTADIAKEMNLGIDTVKKDLQAARRSGLITAARDQIITLVPKAIATLEAHLDLGDKDVALLVLEGLGVIGKHMQITMEPSSGVREDTFYEFRARVLQTKSAGTAPVATNNAGQPAQSLGPVVDAEIETPGGESIGVKGVAAEAVCV